MYTYTNIAHIYLEESMNLPKSVEKERTNWIYFIFSPLLKLAGLKLYLEFKITKPLSSQKDKYLVKVTTVL